MSEEHKPEEKENYGHATVGVGTDQERKVAIESYVRADFIDHRLISVMSLEDGTFAFSVENPLSTGRATSTTMWLSAESLGGLLFTVFLLLNGKGISVEKLFEQSVRGDNVDFEYSTNITPLKSEDHD